jgi:anti-sigma factor RsiW
MTPNTRHVTEEELILHYYGAPAGALSGEASAERRVEQHLATCPSCREELEHLRRVLELVNAEGLNPEPPGPAFEREVWARLQPQLTSRRQSWFSRFFGTTAKATPTRVRWGPRQSTPTRVPRWGPRQWATAGGVAGLMLVAFLAGRISDDVLPPSAPTTTADGDFAERVLVVAVVDHLDRSQMVLLEVLNGDFSRSADFAAEQSIARELVTANRLYRQTAVRTGDDATGSVLDELERVLLEIANAPQNATKDDLEALQAQIAAGGMLFKVRVVRSEMRERERESVTKVSESKS